MTAKPDKYKTLPKPAFYDPLSKPINIYSYPHIYEQCIEQDKKTSQEISNKSEHLNKVSISHRLSMKKYKAFSKKEA